MHHTIDWPQDKSALYPLLSRQIKALIEGCPPVSALANVASILWEALPDINWAGFYLLKNDVLYLGPFHGKTACVMIPMGRGVCGTSAATRMMQLVPDVELFPGHIACDSASRSEIVVPIIVGEQLMGVLDIDAPIQSRFSEEDAAGLCDIVRLLSNDIDWANGLL